MIEVPIAKVTHFFNHLHVAAIHMDQGELAVGDTVHVKGHTSDFTTRIDSMEVEHHPVVRVGPGANAGIHLSGHAREHDRVYKVA